MKPFRLTPQAEARLPDIALWTVNQFGVDQARRYERELIDRLKPSHVAIRRMADHAASSSPVKTLVMISTTNKVDTTFRKSLIFP